MKKTCLVEKLVENNGLTKKAAGEIVDTMFDAITEALKKGEAVDIFGFGKFEVKTRAARTAKNPRTGEVVKVPATKVPGFKAAKALKEAVK